jgi:hypothetical protein
MNTTEDLTAKLEQLVRDHISEIQRSAAAAVTRAFGSPSPTTKQQPRQHRQSQTGNRRDPEEVSALAERLHAAVCSAPGETMAVLAERVGATVSELNRPMNNLRRAGRLRSAGARSQTRYFPAVNGAASSRAR